MPVRPARRARKKPNVANAVEIGRTGGVGAPRVQQCQEVGDADPAARVEVPRARRSAGSIKEVGGAGVGAVVVVPVAPDDGDFLSGAPLISTEVPNLSPAAPSLGRSLAS